MKIAPVFGIALCTLLAVLLGCAKERPPEFVVVPPPEETYEIDDDPVWTLPPLELDDSHRTISSTELPDFGERRDIEPRHQGRETSEVQEPPLHSARRGLMARGATGPRVLPVLVALVWLKNHQNPDGMWSCREFMLNCKKGHCGGPGAEAAFDVGVTGLALLAFLGAGHTYKHGKFKNTVKKALKAMKLRQGPDGCFGEKWGDHWIYNHAIASLAWAEAFRNTNKSPLIQGIAQWAADFLVDCQNPGMGWSYDRILTVR